MSKEEEEESMAKVIQLTAEPIRVTSAQKQELRLSRRVTPHNELELLCRVVAGSVTIKILTGNQIETEDGWVELGTFGALSADNSEAITLTNPLRFVRWEAASESSGTFMISGVARSN